MNDKSKKRLDTVLKEAIKIIHSSDDAEIPELLGDGIMQSFLGAIVQPKSAKEQSIYDYLFENKNRLQLLALIRLTINNNYSIKVKEADVFVSPEHIQWYKNGVMFLQGGKRFEGSMGLYQGGRVKFGITSRMILGGEKIGPDDIKFVDVEELRERSKQPSVPKNSNKLDKAIADLETLLRGKDNNESKYQNYLIKNPWVLGTDYKQIEPHKPFNDKNIPDFIGVQFRDSACDIIEIKPPFLSLFTKENDFGANFHAAWDQAERYLDFARRDSDYLKREKDLIFENPKCYLLAGYNLTKEQLKKIRRKERMNSSITILTYT